MYKFEEVIEDYKREYGLKKYRKINSHIRSSKKTKKLIKEVLKNNAYPYGEDIVVTVLSHFRYSLAGSETVLVASLIILRMLIEELENTTMAVDDGMINHVEKQIFKKCRETQIR